jgi:2-keto-4-pentenoate hydratase
MTDDDVFDFESACDRLMDHRDAGTKLAALPIWPERLRPDDLYEAMVVQQAWGVFDGEASGYKLAATNVAGQRHINVDGPLIGTLFETRALENGATVSLAGNHMRVAEMELAFRFERKVNANGEVTIDDIRAAVGSIHPAIEVPDSRYRDYTKVGPYQITADNACAWHHLIGPAGPDDWREWDLDTFTVRGGVTGGDIYEGVGANVLGSPWNALLWAVQEMDRLDIELSPGDLIMTGTLSTPIPIVPGDEVVADFGPLGTLALTFRE